jgi:hypothetical protein
VGTWLGDDEVEGLRDDRFVAGFVADAAGFLFMAIREK